MSVTRLRAVVSGVCVVSIVTMIVSSVLDRNGVALAAGLVAALAVLCLMVATAVAPGPRPATAEDEGARVEALVVELAARGADEAVVRSLAAAAVRLGRAQSAGSGPVEKA